MKNLLTASVFAFGISVLAPVAHAAEKCDEVTLLSVEVSREPQKGGGWKDTHRGRFIREDNVIMTVTIDPKDVGDAVMQRVKYDFGPKFRLCSIDRKVDVLPVLK